MSPEKGIGLASIRIFTSGVVTINSQTPLPPSNGRQLSIKIEDFYPVALISLSGHLAQLEVYKLKSQADALINEGKRFLVLDLLKVDYIDSAGIGALLHMRSETQRKGGDLCLVKPTQRNVLQILQLTSLQKIFTFHEDAVKALKTIREKNGLTATLADDTPDPMGPMAEKLIEYEVRIKDLEERIAQLEKKVA